MKRLIFLFVILVCVMSAQAVEYFRYTNAEGVELRYRIINTKEVAVASDVNPSLWDSTVVNYPNILCDSIRIPDTVEYNGNSYMVFGIDNYSFACMKNVKKVILPKTIRSAPSLAFNYNSGIEEIIVDEENPYYTTVNGVMYTKDMKCLTAYPSAKPDPVFIVPEGPQSVAMFAFILLRNLKDITMPLTLNTMENGAMITGSIQRAVFQDSVTMFEYGACSLYEAEEIVLGNRVDTFNSPIIAFSKPITLTCRTITPPYFPLQSAEGSHLGESTLRVPMQSVAAYQQADGWKLFGNIVSIEPPVVTGLDNVQVSWVQNFSATGYVWILYTDEAHTQRYMTLTFDANGHLTGIDLAGNQAPARLSAIYEEAEDEPTQFAEYYSFTITGLSANTTYYFVRQSLNGTDIIDEENGTFATQSSATAIDNINNASAPIKVISNGGIFIKQGDKTYTLQGQEVK